MASAGQIDLDGMLAALDGESPAGVDLRADSSADSPYRVVRQRRSEASREEKGARTTAFDDSAEPVPLSRQLEDIRARSAPLWKEIKEKSTTILAKQSKDLEVASTLLEALLRQDGFAGLRSGLRLVRELAERYWDDLYPRPDEVEGMYARVVHLRNLNGEDKDGALIAPIRRAPLFNGVSGAPSLAEFDIAGEEGARTLSELERDLNSAGTVALAEARTEIRGCLEELSQLDAVLTERCGVDVAPPLGNIRAALEACDELVARYLPSEMVEDKPEGADEASGDGAVRVSSGEMTREDALRSLQKIAEFFRRTEPHSPMSWAIEQTIRWGRMSMPDLWAELISDESNRREVFRLIGVPRPQEESF